MPLVQVPAGVALVMLAGLLLADWRQPLGSLGVSLVFGLMAVAVWAVVLPPAFLKPKWLRQREEDVGRPDKAHFENWGVLFLALFMAVAALAAFAAGVASALGLG